MTAVPEAADIAYDKLHPDPYRNWQPEPDWAGPGFSTPYADPEREPEAGS